MDHVTRHYQTLMDLTRQEQQDADLKRDLQGWSGFRSIGKFNCTKRTLRWRRSSKLTGLRRAIK